MKFVLLAEHHVMYKEIKANQIQGKIDSTHKYSLRFHHLRFLSTNSIRSRRNGSSTNSNSCNDNCSNSGSFGNSRSS